jgi:pimeloyl-ACP methyl ester carboxylesterase
MNDLVFEHHRTSNGDVGLHAVSLGGGPAVILIHGFPQHWWMWRATMRTLADAGYRAIAIDQRGCGGSDIPHGGYSKASLAGDVAAVMDALNITNASVIGYDHGGGTALALAYTAPQRVNRLAVIEYAPPGFGYEMGLTAAPGNVNWQLAFFTHPDVAVQFIAGKERELLSWYFWHWAYNPDAVDQADFEVYVRQLQKPGALRGGMMHFASVFEDMALFKGWAEAGRLAMPCLGIGGEIAAGIYGEMALKALAEKVSGAVIPKAGHWIAEEQPEALNKCLLDFLGAS